MTKQIIGELEHTGKYIPRLDEIYCYIDIYGDITTLSNICTSDEWIIKHNHVFRGEEDCEIYRAYMELLDEYTFEPNWKDLSQDKYYLVYDAAIDKVRADLTHRYKISSYYFETLDKLNEFIEKAGEQNIKRFMFDIWE